jgi:hypothetical protein
MAEEALLLYQNGLLDVSHSSDDTCAAPKRGSDSNGTGIKGSDSKGVGMKIQMLQFSQSFALRLESIGLPRLTHSD